MKRRGFLGLLMAAPAVSLVGLPEKKMPFFAVKCTADTMNIAIGNSAFDLSNNRNTAVGVNALSCAGSNNVAVGYQSLYDTTTGGHDWRWPGNQ